MFLLEKTTKKNSPKKSSTTARGCTANVNVMSLLCTKILSAAHHTFIEIEELAVEIMHDMTYIGMIVTLIQLGIYIRK